MRFWIAWQLLTIIPSPPRYRGYSVEDLGRSISFFPVVGLFLGLVLFGLDYLLGLFLPSIVVNILLIIALVILTGALHLDGFVDTCDGLVVRSSASDKLRIMADSQVGVFGVVGGCCLILTKFAALFALPEGLRASVLILMPILSRWGMVYAIYAFSPAKAEGLGCQAKDKLEGDDSSHDSCSNYGIGLFKLVGGRALGGTLPHPLGGFEISLLQIRRAHRGQLWSLKRVC